MIINNDKIFKDINNNRKAINELFNEPLIRNPFVEDFAKRFCWSSNHIEGNTLSLDETIEFLEYDTVKSRHTYREYTEAKSLYKTIQKFLVPIQARDISETYIKSVNAMIMNSDGMYRMTDVYIGSLTEAVYYPPKWGDVSEYMKNYIETVNNINSYDVCTIMCFLAEKHMEFERIHPFVDGNGRTGRVILNQQLINYGFLPVCIDQTSDYRQAFRMYDKNKDISKMVHIICKEQIRSGERILQLNEKLNRVYQKKPR